MLEIYNETVKDLLNTSSFKKGGLRVREHPSKGFFGNNIVSSLKTHFSYNSSFETLILVFLIQLRN